MSSRAWTSIRRGWEHLTASLAGQAVPVRRGVSLSGARADRRPSFDVLESEHELLVRCDVPGVRRDALDVCVDGDRLVVTAAASSDFRAPSPHAAASAASDEAS